MTDVILYTSISGRLVGGGQHSLMLLLQRLDRARFTPMVLVPDEGDFTERLRAMGIEILCMPVGKLHSFLPGPLGKAIAFLREKRVAAVHADSPRQALCTGIAARIARIPFIFHARVGDPGRLWSELLLYILANRIVAVSSAAARRFTRFSPKSTKVRVVYNAVELDRYAGPFDPGKLRGQMDIGNRILIGTAGQLLPRKGFEIFLRAGALIAARNGDRIRLIIIGRGEAEYERTLRKLADSLGIGSIVIFAGFRTDIPDILNAMDLFVLATMYREGLSRVIIEAMAAGTPVIATDIGGNPEAVVRGKNGLLVPPGDPRALADAIWSLVDDREKRDAMGTAGRSMAEARFNPGRQIEQIHALYEEVLCRMIPGA